MPSETKLTPQEALRVLDTHHESLGFHRPTQCKFAQALAALRAAVEWRPIESVPRDGTPVLLLMEYHFRSKPPEYQHDVGYWTTFNGGRWVCAHGGTPVAWMPIPPATPPTPGGA
jgi:hypothetical protein